MADMPGATFSQQRLEDERGGYPFNFNEQQMHEKLEPTAVDPSSAISTAAG
jgi:hypothetical protein